MLASKPCRKWWLFSSLAVQTVESTRRHVGLYSTELMLRAYGPDQDTLRIVGEIPQDAEASISELFDPFEDGEDVTIWQCPPGARSPLQPELIEEVLAEMRASAQSWSLTTAARALLKAAEIRHMDGHTLSEIKSCWQQAPICTSIVVIFWQRYLCKLARATGQSELALVMRWMPLKADRGLPGELNDVMKRCGWYCLKDLKQVSPQTSCRSHDF